MPSPYEILLQVVGDSSDAERSLSELAREINEFDRQEATADLKLDTSEVIRELEASQRRLADWGREIATATADLDTDAAQEDLNRMRAQLSLLDLSEADPKVQLQTAAAIAKIDALELQLAKLDATDVEIDVDLRRGITERLASLTGDVGRLVGGITDIGPAASDAGGGVLGLTDQFAPMASGGPIAVGIGALVIALSVALFGALTAVFSSAVLAAGALGAIATTATTLLIPAIGLVIGAIQRFKDKSDQAGTAAHALAKAWQGFSDVFGKALGPAADAVFAGLADGLKTIEPLIKSLKPAFTDFGKVAGEAIRTLADEFAKPAWKQFFQTLINAASQVLPPLIDVFISFARIMRDVASDALPFFVDGIRSMAGGMRELAQNARNVDLSTVFAHLGSWLNLAEQLSRVLLNFFAAAAPAGKQLVNFMAQGAQALADWLGSTEGQARVKQFFTDTVPLAKELINAFVQIGIAVIQFGQAVAPILQPMVAGFNQLMGAVNSLLNLFNQIPAPIRNIIGLMIQFAGPLGIAKLALMHLGDAFGWLLDAAKTAWDAIKSATTTAWDAIKTAITAPIQTAKTVLAGAWDGIKAAAKAAWDLISGAAGTVWHVIKTAITAPIQTAKQALSDAWGAIKNAATNAWDALKGAASSVWGAIKGAISDAIHAAKGAVSDAVGAMKSAASGAWDAIKSSASNVLGALKNVVGDAFNAVKGAITGAKDALVSAANDIWNAINDALPDIDIEINLPDKSLLGMLTKSIDLSSLVPGGDPGSLVTGGAPTGFPVDPLTGATVKGGDTFYITSPAGSLPDPTVLAAQIALRQRMRGRR